MAPTWTGEFELPDGSYSVSDIQDYIECIVKSLWYYILLCPINLVSICYILNQAI